MAFDGKWLALIADAFMLLTYGMLSHTDASGLRHPSGRHITHSDPSVSLVLFMTSLDQGGYAYLT